MSIRTRKLLGTVAFVAFVVAYAFIVMVVGSVRLQEAGTAERVLFFGLTGTIWVIPAGAIIWWMERGSRG